MLQQAHLSTAASSFNTLHRRPIGPKKASLLNSSSQLADIVCISNPWSLRQSSIRSSCKRCLCGCMAPSIYIEVVTTVPPTFPPFCFQILTAQWEPGCHCLDIVDPTSEDSQYTGLCLSQVVLSSRILPVIDYQPSMRYHSRGMSHKREIEEQPTWWSHRSLPSRL